MSSKQRRILRLQAAYYVATGIWPLLSRRSFEAITGPKQDWWLVQMVGLLAVTNGLVLASGAAEDPLGENTLLLAVLSAAAFSAIDLYYGLKGRISRLYVADALLETAAVWGLLGA